MKKRYPKSEMVSRRNDPAEAYVSWEGSNATAAFSTYAEALDAGSHSIASRSGTRDYRDLAGGRSGRPGLRHTDFDWFRPDQERPYKDKDIIAWARQAYRNIGLIHNAIDLMGDFTVQGICPCHPNKKIEKFWRDWFFNQVNGHHVSERLAHLLFREANTVLRFYTAKINDKRRQEMTKTVADVDMDIRLDDFSFKNREIPWRYTFIDPLFVDPLGGQLANLSKNRLLMLKLPHNIKNQIKNIQNSNNVDVKKALEKIPPDIMRAANSNSDILLPPDKTRIYHYRKDDWETWADPMTYSAFEDLNLYVRLKLADKAAVDGAQSKVRVWKLGSLEHKLAPTPTAVSTLSDMLGTNVGGGTIDIVWGPDIELLETSSDLNDFLGEEKYRPTLMAIYAALGIPPTLTGTFGATGTTNNFIALKTLVERLNYVRNIIIQFWREQFAIVQKAMGFRFPAELEFDIMHLDDPVSMATLLVNMADRNMISDEFVQKNVKAKPHIEKRRIRAEDKDRDRSNQEKISPYHSVDQDHSLRKIALQNGSAAPSEVGLELDPKKEGEKSLMEMKEQQRRVPQDQSVPGQPGRPKNSQDDKPRKERTFLPKTKASAELWAKQAQAKLSDELNSVLLQSFGKKSLRELTTSQLNHLESIKFELLCSLDVGDDVNVTTIAKAMQNVDVSVHEEFDSWLTDATNNFGKLKIDDIRDLRISYCIYYKYEK